MAFVELDQLGMCYPETGEDPGRHRLKGEALPALIEIHSELRLELLLVSGVLNPGLMEWYHYLLHDRADLHLIQLIGAREVLRQRNVARGRSPNDIALMFEHAAALDLLADQHPSIDTNVASVEHVASAVLEALGLSEGCSTDDARVAMPTHPLTGPVLRPEPAAAQAIWIRGATASGKSTVAWALFKELLRSERRVAYLDINQLAFSALSRDVKSSRFRGRGAHLAGDLILQRVCCLLKLRSKFCLALKIQSFE